MRKEYKRTAGYDELLVEKILLAIQDFLDPKNYGHSKGSAEAYIRSKYFIDDIDAVSVSADAELIRDMILSGKLTFEDFKKNLRGKK